MTLREGVASVTPSHQEATNFILNVYTEEIGSLELISSKITLAH